MFGSSKLGISLALIVVALACNKRSLIVQNTNKGCNELTLYIKELYTKFSLTKTIVKLSSLLIEANYFQSYFYKLTQVNNLTLFNKF